MLQGILLGAHRHGSYLRVTMVVSVRRRCQCVVLTVDTHCACIPKPLILFCTHSHLKEKGSSSNCYEDLSRLANCSARQQCNRGKQCTRALFHKVALLPQFEIIIFSRVNCAFQI